MSIIILNLDNPGQALDRTPPASTTPADPLADSACCGGAAAASADSCCALDADIKASGGSGCGCSSTAPAPAKSGCC